MSMLNDILRNAVQAKASDVHINVGSPPLFRIHTIVQPSDFPIVTPRARSASLKEMLNDKRWAEFEEKRDADFSYEIPGVGRFRVNAHYQRGTYRAGVPYHQRQGPPLEQLFMPEIVGKLTHLPRGLILVTGGTGSGKSTTLAGMVDLINKREQGHIITLEDPIEYAFVSNKCSIEQREVGADVPSFASGLRTCCVRTRTRSWSAKCATWKRSARHHRGRNGSPGLQHAAHRSTRRRRSSESSTSTRPTSRTRSARCSPTRCRRYQPDAVQAHRPAGHDPGRRDHVVHAGRAKLHPREPHLRNPEHHRDEPRAGHADAGRLDQAVVRERLHLAEDAIAQAAHPEKLERSLAA
jgi:energy-coupling factor transporter ATP-binding protein EcfA2